MKILMVLESGFPPDIRVSNEAYTLIEAGHEVHIACLLKNGQPETEIQKGLVIHRFKMGSLRYKSSVGALKFRFYFQFWEKRLSALLRSEKFEAIHVHDLPLASLALKLKKKYGLHYVLDLHENWPALLNISTHTKSLLGRVLCSIPQWEQYEKEQVSLADRVVVVVDEAKDRLVMNGAEKEKIAVVSNTLNMELFNFPEQIRDSKFVTMVYGGGINYHRGIQYVIEATPSIIAKIPNFRLWIIGSGSYLAHLKEQVESLGISRSVKFFGWKKQDELLKLVSQSDYAIIPHIRSPHTDATLPHKIFQYMYAGIPILSSDCKPLKRILTETGTGKCFEDRNVESLSKTFLELHKETLKVGRNIENGQKWVREKYNWSKDGTVLVNLYHQFD